MLSPRDWICLAERRNASPDVGLSWRSGQIDKGRNSVLVFSSDFDETLLLSGTTSATALLEDSQTSCTFTYYGTHWTLFCSSVQLLWHSSIEDQAIENIYKHDRLYVHLSRGIAANKLLSPSRTTSLHIKTSTP